MKIFNTINIVSNMQYNFFDDLDMLFYVDMNTMFHNNISREFTYNKIRMLIK